MKLSPQERINLVYELESLIDKKNKSTKEKNRVKEIRLTLGGGKSPRVKIEKKTIDKYVELRKDNPDMTDEEIAKILGIKPSSLRTLKTRNKIKKSEIVKPKWKRKFELYLQAKEQYPDATQEKLIKAAGMHASTFCKYKGFYEKEMQKGQ